MDWCDRCGCTVNNVFCNIDIWCEHNERTYSHMMKLVELWIFQSFRYVVSFGCICCCCCCMSLSMKHVLSVSSISVSVGGHCRIMFRKLRYDGSNECLIDVWSLCCFAIAQDGAEIMWPAVQRMSRNLGLCMDFAGSWARFPNNIKSLFCNEYMSVVRVLCLRRCFTAHNILLVIIDISSMIMKSAFFNVVKKMLGSGSTDK